jgi:hypothetical protein
MHSRLTSFFEKLKILSDFQFGFRENYSPNLALTYLIDRISSALEKGEFVLGLFLDFSKAFDTVNHQILLQKLQCYGIRGVALKWISNYLSEREQYVEIDGVKSNMLAINCGVPQGSILGPLLFLVYINDLPDICKKCFPVFFADDSNLFVSGNDPEQLISTINNEMLTIVNWLNTNKLSLNVKKTHYILFKSRRKNIVLHSNVKINNIIIDQVNYTKFLGVVIDCHLLWDEHVKYIKSKISKSLGILYKAKKYLKHRNILPIYYAFIHPYFIYCIEVWGITFNKYINSLVILHKRAVRVIKGVNRYDSTKPLYTELKLLTVPQMYVYFVQIWMYKYYHDKQPLVFKNMFCHRSEFHTYQTRQANLYHLPLCHLSSSKKTIRCSGVYCNNYFIEKVSYTYSVPVYKSKIKSLILSDIESIDSIASCY